MPGQACFHLLVMKKLFLFSVVALFFGAFTTQKAQAQHCASRVLSVCPVCHQNVYAYYRPVNYGGCIRYMWVPAYHTACAAHRSHCNHGHTHSHRSHASHAIRYITNYSRITPYRYVTPTYGFRHYTTCSPYAGYVRPGFSISISR